MTKVINSHRRGELRTGFNLRGLPGVTLAKQIGGASQLKARCDFFQTTWARRGHISDFATSLVLGCELCYINRGLGGVKRLFVSLFF